MSISVVRIRDVYPGSELFPSGSRIRIKEFEYFNPKKWFLSSRKYDPGCSSRIPDPDPDFLPILDPGVKKAPDPGSGTLVDLVRIRLRRSVPLYYGPGSVSGSCSLLQWLSSCQLKTWFFSNVFLLLIGTFTLAFKDNR